MKRRLLFPLVGFHLAMMVCPVFRPGGHTGLGKFLNGYARLTGAGANFGFFSPNVTNQLTIGFIVTDKNNRSQRVAMEDLVSGETSIRVKNMFRFFTKIYSYPRIRRSVAASFVAYLFQRYPEAETITLEASFFRLPGVAEYQKDRRVYRDPVYRATFSRS